MENGNMARRDYWLYHSEGNNSVDSSEMRGRSFRQKENFEKKEERKEREGYFEQ